MNLSPKLPDHLHLIPSATAYLLHLPLSSAGCLRIDRCIGELVACSAAVCPNKKRLVICIITLRHCGAISLAMRNKADISSAPFQLICQNSDE